jgi:hypothetical protein
MTLRAVRRWNYDPAGLGLSQVTDEKFGDSSPVTACGYLRRLIFICRRPSTNSRLNASSSSRATSRKRSSSWSAVSTSPAEFAFSSCCSLLEALCNQ